LIIDVVLVLLPQVWKHLGTEENKSAERMKECRFQELVQMMM
jgi:hypothetical protein